MSRRKREIGLQLASQNINNRTFLDIYTRLKNLAVTRFQWKNLPLTCDARTLEMRLFDRGNCHHFDEELVGNLTLPCTLSGGYTVYGIPTRRRPFSISEQHSVFDFRDPSNSVIIFNNYARTDTSETIILYSYLLYEIRRAIDVNVKGQKTPILLRSSEKQRLTLRNLYMQYDGNIPFIFGDPNLNLSDMLEAIRTDVPYVSDKLKILYNNIYNEVLSFLGIENANQDKRERLVAEEVGGNDGNVEANRESFLVARQEAAEQINAMFGTNIKVAYRSNLDTNVNRATLGFPVGMDMLTSPAIVDKEGGRTSE